jgi:hypothetical protein
MILKDTVIEQIKEFRINSGIERSDENLSMILHLVNNLSLDKDSAIDQSSNQSSDFGIDGWFLSKDNNELMIYQSKLSESKQLALKGLHDLLNGLSWLEPVFINGMVNKPPDNPALYNLYIELSKSRRIINQISFVLLTLYNSNELEDSPEVDEFNSDLEKSGLYKHLRQLGGSSSLRFEQYCLVKGPKKARKKYSIKKLKDSTITLRDNAHLDLAYIPLYELVELYRQRGDVLFDKNIRMSILHSKEAKQRLVNPMEATFDAIIKKEVDPNIFPFYHVGITLSALRKHEEENDIMNLESPSIINGAQTITIANQYYKKLQAQNQPELIDIFRQIKVIVKIVTGTSDDELKEITNSNNRQNPIENWQLFSNDSIHVSIELVLKERGIFYERQRGKFEAIMKIGDFAKYYYNTNNTYITIAGLGQIIAVSTNKLQWAAKHSDIFLNKQNHDSIFIDSVPNYPRDIIFLHNLFKAMRRSLTNYKNMPSHLNDSTQYVFTKQMVNMHVYHMTMLFYYQVRQKDSIRKDYSTKLLKIANPTLVSDIENFFTKNLTKVRIWYVEESNNLSDDVSHKKLDSYFSQLLIEIGIDMNGLIPFSAKTIQWDE